MISTYFAVNKDGTEICSNNPLHRYNEVLERWHKNDLEDGLDTDLEIKEDDYYWTNQYENTDYYDGIVFYSSVSILPKGTILTITGKTLTWDDDPICIMTNDVKRDKK